MIWKRERDQEKQQDQKKVFVFQGWYHIRVKHIHPAQLLQLDAARHTFSPSGVVEAVSRLESSGRLIRLISFSLSRLITQPMIPANTPHIFRL
ncbi:MAG: hypothetical protein MRJ65_15165 [Candidatus Brocadiaceae bacterium]|nr:hypothetical protein [Candidatus Brocadiaceae bacterium]